MNRVMVAMSGGVDSSVAAYLIKSSGVDAVGATLKLFSNEDIQLDRTKTCCSLSDVEDARSVANRLGIPYYVFNFSDNFKEKVIGRFIATYESGGTPNPCIDCNRFIKFKQLLTRAELMECDHIATGHYARVEYDSNSDRWLLKKAADSHKDQTYVLASLNQEQLAHTLFPLGGLTKSEVRQIADEQNFLNADKPDSQDICFVPDGNYARFIEEYTNHQSIPGNFIDTTGKIVGKHKGIIHYTLGQRKKLGVSMGRPIFVCNIDPQTNTVTLGDEPDLYSKSLTARDINLIALPEIKSPIRVTAKTRYSHKEAAATLEQTGANELHIEFDEPQRAITKGQSVVIYSDEVVIGSGTIV
ncbi:MAG: tRNA 2-thiouridine(34) synthase MnmA [Clostridiales bacterium]|nr:tRNA 2-thiouridine(34) synthase MnmA [Clostridiales bacterium]